MTDYTKEITQKVREIKIIITRIEASSAYPQVHKSQLLDMYARVLLSYENMLEKEIAHQENIRLKRLEIKNMKSLTPWQYLVSLFKGRV